jgi:hypothetical protein
MVMLEKENCLKEYKFWSYEKGKINLVFNVVCYIKFFNIWVISKEVIKINSPLKYSYNI